MAEEPAYDLMVLIDPDVPEERRIAIVQDVRKQIDSGEGELKGDAEWGVRKLAYEVDHRTEAYYHLFQLEAKPELLKQIEHALAIDDGVLRHRILRLSKGVPETTPRPDPTPARAPTPPPESDSAETESEEPPPSEAQPA
jgi:small subunit ribosomal protein S6